MGGFDTDYPTAVDPAPAALLDGKDYLPSSALKLMINQILAMQAELGNDPVDFTALGGKALDFGTIEGFMRQLFRIEGGVETIPAYYPTAVHYEVTFTSGRFSAPPYVMLQPDDNPLGSNRIFFPKKVTKDKFIIAPNRLWVSTTYDVQWLAIQGLFGVDEHEDES